MVRWLLMILSIICAMPALAQTPQWNPAAPYVTAGQDEPGYRAWLAGANWRPVYVKAFHDYLTTYGVGGVAPTWQLLRTATDWQKCGADPFEVPPPNSWPNIVAALQADGGSYTWAAATTGSQNAASYQLASGYPVMAIGGFNGSDPSPTLDQFKAYVAAGKIHYYIGGSVGQSAGGSSDADEIATWVSENFTATTVGDTTVYDLTQAN